MRSIITYLSFIFLFVSCSKQKVEPEEYNSGYIKFQADNQEQFYKNLPVANCYPNTVADEEASGTYITLPNLIYPFLYFTREKNNQLIGEPLEHSMSISLSNIELDEVITPYEVKGGFINNTSSFGQLQLNFLIDGEYQTFMGTSNDDVKITIIYLDKINSRIKGTFEGELKSLYTESKVKITNGSFDIKYKKKR